MIDTTDQTRVLIRPFLEAPSIDVNTEHGSSFNPKFCFEVNTFPVEFFWERMEKDFYLPFCNKKKKNCYCNGLEHSGLSYTFAMFIIFIYIHFIKCFINNIK